MELGTGFAYMGSEVRIEVGDTEKFIDMLFYNTQRHCYVVVGIKTGKFDSSYAGQLGTYVGEIDLPEALLEMLNRGKAVPGGACGFWGACGAGISTGMFISIISGATPLKNKPWGLANKMTSKALDAIGSIGGPRCCKRDSYVAIISAIDYVAENFNIQMEKPVIKCIHSNKNNQCIKERCPFHE